MIFYHIYSEAIYSFDSKNVEYRIKKQDDQFEVIDVKEEDIFFIKNKLSIKYSRDTK